MIKHKNEITLSIEKALLRSMMFSGVFWTGFFVISKMLNIRDYSNTITPWMYCSLVFVSSIAWAVRLYYIEKKIERKYEDRYLIRAIAMSFGASLVTAILLWAGFCLMTPAFPSGVISFSLLIVMTMLVIELFINIRRVFLIGAEEIKEYVLYLLGVEKIDDDDEY